MMNDVAAITIMKSVGVSLGIGLAKAIASKPYLLPDFIRQFSVSNILNGNGFRSQSHTNKIYNIIFNSTVFPLLASCLQKYAIKDALALSQTAIPSFAMEVGLVFVSNLPTIFSKYKSYVDYTNEEMYQYPDRAKFMKDSVVEMLSSVGSVLHSRSMQSQDPLGVLGGSVIVGLSHYADIKLQCSTFKRFDQIQFVKTALSTVTSLALMVSPLNDNPLVCNIVKSGVTNIITAYRFDQSLVELTFGKDNSQFEML